MIQSRLSELKAAGMATISRIRIMWNETEFVYQYVPHKAVAEVSEIGNLKEVRCCE